MRNIVLVIIFLIILLDIAKADTMYCGNNLISDGDSKAKVILRCGEPFYKTTAEAQSSIQSQTLGQIQQQNKNTYDYGSNTSSRLSDVSIEKWYYNLGAGQFIHILTFKGDICIKIETGDKP